MNIRDLVSAAASLQVAVKYQEGAWSVPYPVCMQPTRLSPADPTIRPQAVLANSLCVLAPLYLLT